MPPLFGQTFELHDLALVGFLVVLEGVLSVDNALVLGVLAKRLPKSLQKRALTYGLIGAFVFRFIAIGAAAWLMHLSWVKLVGGGYLVWIAIKHFFFDEAHDDTDPSQLDESGVPTNIDAQSRKLNWNFWHAVLVIEITDIAFAVDSILAAIGVLPKYEGDAQFHPKLWIVLAGGFLGVIMMRFASMLFIRLLETFPRFNTSAYLLVIVIGLKLLLEFAVKYSESLQKYVDFHHAHSPGFWAFWGAMAVSFLYGFWPTKKDDHSAQMVD